jgi:hypothetical protein
VPISKNRDLDKTLKRPWDKKDPLKRLCSGTVSKPICSLEDGGTKPGIPIALVARQAGAPLTSGV